MDNQGMDNHLQGMGNHHHLFMDNHHLPIIIPRRLHPSKDLLWLPSGIKEEMMGPHVSSVGKTPTISQEGKSDVWLSLGVAASSISRASSAACPASWMAVRILNWFA